MTRTYGVRQAKANLSRILKEVERGVEVMIARGGKPVAKIVPIQYDTGTAKPVQKTVRRAGTLKGILTWDSKAFEPLTDDEFKDWGIE